MIYIKTTDLIKKNCIAYFEVLKSKISKRFKQELTFFFFFLMIPFSFHSNSGLQCVWALCLTWKGMVRLILSPTFLMYFVLSSLGRRIFGYSKVGQVIC